MFDVPISPQLSISTVAEYVFIAGFVWVAAVGVSC